MTKEERHTENPFAKDVVIIPRRQKVSGVDTNRVIRDTNTGAEQSISFSFNVIKEEEAFVKIYKDSIKKMFELSGAAYKVFWYACVNMRPNNDVVYIQKDEFMQWAEYKNRKSFYDGIHELIEKQILAQNEKDDWYYVNHAVVFNGSRMKIETIYYKV